MVMLHLPGSHRNRTRDLLTLAQLRLPYRAEKTLREQHKRISKYHGGYRVTRLAFHQIARLQAGVTSTYWWQSVVRTIQHT
jgi:hypothetical protein